MTQKEMQIGVSRTFNLGNFEACASKPE